MSGRPLKLVVFSCWLSTFLFAQVAPIGSEERERLLREATKDLLKNLENVRRFLLHGVNSDEMPIVTSIVFRVPDQDTDDTMDCFAGLDPVNGSRVIWVGLGFARALQMFIDAKLITNSTGAPGKFEAYIEYIRSKWKDNLERGRRGLVHLPVASPYEYFHTSDALVDSIARDSNVLYGGALAFVVAHEAGHHVLRHDIQSRAQPIEREKAADRWAVQTMLAAGEPPFAGVLVLSFLDSFFAADSNHPAPEDRMKELIRDTLTNLDRFADRARSNGVSIEEVRKQLSAALRDLNSENVQESRAAQGRDVPLSSKPDDYEVAFRTALDLVLRATRANLQTIKGPPDPDGDGEAWQSSVRLPGAEECSVWVMRDRSLGIRPYYSCVMGTGTDLDALRARYAALATVVAASLGNSWTSRQTVSESRPFKTVFTGGGCSCDVSVFVAKFSESEVRLEIEVQMREH